MKILLLEVYEFCIIYVMLLLREVHRFSLVRDGADSFFRLRRMKMGGITFLKSLSSSIRGFILPEVRSACNSHPSHFFLKRLSEPQVEKYEGKCLWFK